MILKEVLTFNYKSCKSTRLNLKANRPSLFIGENDCGKTSALNSIRFLLEHASKINLPNDKSEKNDLSHSALSNNDINQELNALNLPGIFETEGNDDFHVVFIGIFEIESFELNNENISSQLRWALESSITNENGHRELIKARVFNANTGASNVYYMHKHPRDLGLNSLYVATQTQINAAMLEYNPNNENLVNDNSEGRYSNYEKMRSIIKTVESDTKFVAFSDESKQKKWKIDLTVFPEYAYLSWNESLEGITKAASAILDSSIEHELKRAQVFSKALKKRAQNKIDKKLSELGIHNEVSSIQSITANISFELQNKLTDLFVKKTESESDVHIENQGEGIKRQIWFALLKLQAEDSLDEENTKRYVWCFDEPETHLHPKAQREFLKTLSLLCHQNFQIVISTHSTMFVNATHINEINTFDIVNNYSVVGTSHDVEDVYDALGLKNSDFLFYDKFLIVEGNTEETLIPALYEKYTSRTLREDNIQLINLNGCTNSQLAESMLNRLIEGFAKTEDLSVYLFDADTRKAADERTFIIGKQDLEDSIPLAVWIHLIKEIYGEIIALSIDELNDIYESIPTVDDAPDLNENQKFAARLKAEICKKLVASDNAQLIGDWPNKSHDWGKAISRHMSLVDIPLPIKCAFDAVNEKRTVQTEA